MVISGSKAFEKQTCRQEETTTDSNINFWVTTSFGL